jgi:chaperonin GroEL (HSP60 family)
MLVGYTRDATITMDGTTILKAIDVEHPVAKMPVEVEKYYKCSLLIAVLITLTPSENI